MLFAVTKSNPEVISSHKSILHPEINSLASETLLLSPPLIPVFIKLEFIPYYPLEPIKLD